LIKLDEQFQLFAEQSKQFLENIETGYLYFCVTLKSTAQKPKSKLLPSRGKMKYCQNQKSLASSANLNLCNRTLELLFEGER